MDYRSKGTDPHLSEEEWEQQCEEREREKRSRDIEALLADLDVEVTSPAPAAKVGNYSFPARPITQTIADHAGLRQTLLELAPQINSHGTYASVRARWCALHLQLNSLGLWAPAYRPWPKLPQKPREQCADSDHNLHRDRIVIDAHWLHSRAELVSVEPKRAPTWQPLFNPALPFDFEMAERFAQQVWSDDFRTGEVLCLTPYQQCQMGAMRTKAHKQLMESFNKITYGADRKRIASPAAVVRVALAEWRERQANLGDPNRLLGRAEARYYLSGRRYNGRTVIVSFYPEASFD